MKWFDFSKGYGFVASSEGGADILLHQACVRQSEFEAVRDGASVILEVVEGPRGLQASRLVALDNSTAQPAAPADHIAYATIAASGEWQDGMVKWFSRIRGYGFIARGPGRPDLFVHVETLKRCGIADFREGQELRFRVGDGPKGELAAEVELKNEPGANR